ncbi:MAG: hypothetical protein RLZZ383_2318 [Pseudomonadota bacterium]
MGVLLAGACGAPQPEVVGAAPLPPLPERPVRHGNRVASLALWPVAGWVGFDATPGLTVWSRGRDGEAVSWDGREVAPVSQGPRALAAAAAAVVSPTRAADAVSGPGCDPGWRDGAVGSLSVDGQAWLDRCGDGVVLRTATGGALDVAWVGPPTGSWWIAAVDPWVVVRQEGTKAKVVLWSAHDPEGEVRRTFALPLGVDRTFAFVGGAQTPQQRDPLGYWDVDLTATATWQHVRWADGTLLALGETPVDGRAAPASWRIEGVAPLPTSP